MNLGENNEKNAIKLRIIVSFFTFLHVMWNIFIIFATYSKGISPIDYNGDFKL